MARDNFKPLPVMHNKRQPQESGAGNITGYLKNNQQERKKYNFKQVCSRCSFKLPYWVLNTALYSICSKIIEIFGKEKNN